MSKQVAVLFCPGRGSYGRDELGFIGRHLREGEVRDALTIADAARVTANRPTISELDAAERFRPGLHLDGTNAAELIYFSTMAHLEALRDDFEIVAIAGNSLGWYTALPASGALSAADGWRLVSTMARLQQRAEGAQLLTTTIDSEWRPDPDLIAATDRALATVASRGDDWFVARSIRLGGHEVLAGTTQGVQALLQGLPKVDSGERSFPFQLAGHGPFHTALCGQVAERASQELANLPFRHPAVHLIDGRGNVHSPWAADPAELLHYTTTTQVLTTYDFTASVRTAIREFNPDVLLCAGPGTSLRAPVGHVVLAEGFRGIRDKAELFGRELVRAEC